jgi:hypothetical protein
MSSSDMAAISVLERELEHLSILWNSNEIDPDYHNTISEYIKDRLGTLYDL